jgi:hypothetical protein
VTDIEKDAWHKSDVLAKTIEYLYKTDLRPAVRTKMVRDIIKDNLIEFHNQRSNNTRQIQTTKDKQNDA